MIKCASSVVELAVWLDDIELVQYLVEHGGDVHSKSMLGNETVLPCPVELQSGDLLKYRFPNIYFEEYKGKFDLGIDILEMAVVHNLIDFAQLLIEKYIDVRRVAKILIEKGKKTLVLINDKHLIQNSKYFYIITTVKHAI